MQNDVADMTQPQVPTVASFEEEVEAVREDLTLLFTNAYFLEQPKTGQSLADYCRSEAFTKDLRRCLPSLSHREKRTLGPRLARLMGHQWFRDACGGTEPVESFVAGVIDATVTNHEPEEPSDELRALDAVVHALTAHIPPWTGNEAGRPKEEDLAILDRLYKNTRGYASSVVQAWLTAENGSQLQSLSEKILLRALHVPRVRFVLRQLLHLEESDRARETAEKLLSQALNKYEEDESVNEGAAASVGTAKPKTKPKPDCTRLRNVGVDNSFGFASSTVPLGSFNLFVGENGSGKSNMLRSISFVLHHFPSVQYWHNCHHWSPTQPSSIGLEFKLGKEDRDFLIDCFVLIVNEHRIHNEGSTTQYFPETKNWLLRSPHVMTRLFVGYHSDPYNHQRSIPFAMFNYYNTWPSMIATHEGFYTFQDGQDDPDTPRVKKRRILDEMMWDVPTRGLMVRSVENAKRLPHTDVIASARRWPSLFSTGQEKPFRLVDIAQKIIRDRVVLLTENRGMLPPEGPDVNSMSITKISQFVRRLQNGTWKHKRLLGKINRKLRQFAGVEISYVDDPSVPFNLTYRQGPDGEERGIDQLHLGALDLLMVLCTLHYDGASICVLDEPTRSVHPSGRGLVRDYLFNTAQSTGKTVLAIAHDAEMVSELTLSTIFRCVRNRDREKPDLGKTTILELCSTVEKGKDQQDSTKDEGGKIEEEDRKFLAGPEIRGILFANGVIFVEGETDCRFMLALKYAMDWKQLGDKMAKKYLAWDVVPVSGKGNLPRAVRLARSMKIPFVCLCDFDALIPNNLEEHSKAYKINQLELEIKKLNGTIAEKDQQIRDLKNTGHRLDSARRTVLRVWESWQKENEWEEELEKVQKAKQEDPGENETAPDDLISLLRERRKERMGKEMLGKRDVQVGKLSNLDEEQKAAVADWKLCTTAEELATVLAAQEEEANAKKKSQKKGKEKQDSTKDEGGKIKEPTQLGDNSVFPDYQAARKHHTTYAANWENRSDSRGVAILQAAYEIENVPDLNYLYISKDCPQFEAWDERVRAICAAFRNHKVFSWAIDIEHMVIRSDAMKNAGASEEEKEQREKESVKTVRSKKKRGLGQRRGGAQQLAAQLKADWKTHSLNDIAAKVVKLYNEGNEELTTWIQFLVDAGAIKTDLPDLPLTDQASSP